MIAGKPDMVERRERLLEAVRDRRARAFEPDLVHRLAELQPVLGLLDRLGVGADQLDPEPVERPVLVERQRGVERGLPAHRRKQRIGPLLLQILATIAGVTGSI